jgi:hypothetical protein
MIIFLDFDGVLHPFFPMPELMDEENQYFSRTPQLWKILHAIPAAQVVFSTSWRDSHDFDNMLDFVTRDGGENLAHRFLGNTPNLEAEGHYGRRDLEIKRWLTANAHTGAWLAIDDMAELFAGGHPNLYLVNGDCGLTDADAEKIIEKLTRKIS